MYDRARACASRSGCGYGSGFSSTASTSENTAVLAPIASAERQDGGEREAGRLDQLPPAELEVVIDHGLRKVTTHRSGERTYTRIPV